MSGRLPMAPLVLLIAGCASTAPTANPDALFFPRHGSPLGTGDMALLEGVATVEDGCLWIVADDGTRFLALWPSDTRLGMINSQAAVLGPDDQLLAEVGDAFVDRIGLAGSETTRAVAEELVGQIPAACAGEAFWGVSDVVRGP